MIPEVHAIGSCLKAVTTTIAVDGIEQMRRVCGGHGFSSLSGMDNMYGNAMVSRSDAVKPPHQRPAHFGSIVPIAAR